ncbi:MAG: cytidine/deoxycytidylate deaminase family protein [Patescibacteria group bacterium]
MAKKLTIKIINKEVRPTWDEYFMQLVDTVGHRATCDRGRSGCVIVKDKRILTTGYVGSPMGAKHCDEAGHEMHKVVHDDGRETMHCIRTIHAEQNALIQAARVGVSLEGATLYCTMTPCYTCAKLIVNAGIKTVVAKQDYQAANQTKRIFKETKTKLQILNKEVTKY